MPAAENAELARIEPLLPMALTDARRLMTAYQEACAEVLDQTDYETAGTKRFVTRSGFQKLAAFYEVSTEIVSQHVERDDDGVALRAAVVVRAVQRNGRHSEGDGACARSEPRFKGPKSRDKLDHDLTATATTRAKNRAIADLIAFGAVSAEEIDAEGPAPVELADGPAARAAAEALAYVLRSAGIAEPAPPVAALGADLRAKTGGIPVVVAALLEAVANTILVETSRDRLEGPSAPAEPFDEEIHPDLPTETTRAEND